VPMRSGGARAQIDTMLYQSGSPGERLWAGVMQGLGGVRGRQSERSARVLDPGQRVKVRSVA